MASVLSAGDVAVVGYNTGQTDGNGSTSDTLQIVLLAAIEIGTVIYISDRAWNGTAFTAGGGDGTITYTAASNLAAGTVINVTIGGGFDPEEAGDVFYIYQGTDADTPTEFLFAIDTADGNNTFNGNLTNTGLTDGVNAVAVSYDSAAYHGPTTEAAAHLFNAESLIQNIADFNNWVGDDRSGVINALDQPDHSGPYLTHSDFSLWSGSVGGGDGIVSVQGDSTVGSGATGFNLTQLYTNMLDGSSNDLLYRPADIVFDTVHGKFFIADSDLAGHNRILQGNISDLLGNPNQAPTLTVLYSNTGSGAANRITKLEVDPNNGIVYFDLGMTLNKVSYDASGQTPTQLANLGTDNPNGNANNFIDDFVINFANGEVYLSSHRVIAAADGDVISRNYIYKITGLDAADGAGAFTFGGGSITVLPFSPDDDDSGVITTPGEAFPRENGSVEGLALSADGLTLYIATASVLEDHDGDGDPGDAVLRMGGIHSYALTGNAAGAFTTIFQQVDDGDASQTINAFGPQGLLDELEIDPVTGHLYFVDITGDQLAPASNPPGDEGIWRVSTSGGAATFFASINSINSLTPISLFLNRAPTVSASTMATPTVTEPAGLGSGATNLVQLITAVDLTDFETADQTDQLASAVVRISENFRSGAGHADVLTINGTTTGTLDFGSQDIAYSYNSSTGVMTLTGVSTFNNYEAALLLVRFNTSGDNITDYGSALDRTIAWSVSDGLNHSDEVTTTVTVSGTNDDPVNTVPGSESGVEDVVTAINGLSVSDVDADPANQDIVVTLSVTAGTLSVDTAVSGGVTAGDIAGNGTGTVTITATQNQINATFANATGVQLTLPANYNSHINGDVTFTLATNDQGLNGTGGALQDSDNFSIVIAARNDAPTVSAPGPATAATEQVTTTLTGAFDFSDVDLDALNSGNGDYAGSSLTIARSGGADAADVFGFDMTGATFTVSGTSASGALQSGGLTFATYTNSAGTLTINFTSSGTTATSALVDNVSTHVSYTIDDDTPPATVSLVYTFNDGSPSAGGQGAAGGIATVGGAHTVNVTAVNDPPEVNTTVPISGAEDSAFSVHSLSIDDPDSEGDDIVVVFTVPSGGVLTFDTTVASGLVAGDISGNGTNQVTVTATVAEINTTLGAGAGLTYQGPANFNGSVLLNIAVNDQGANPSGALTDNEDQTLTVLAVNDAPVATGSASLTSIAEDTANPSGVAVSTLFASNFSDTADDQTANGGGSAHTLAGVALVGGGASAAGGWQYSTNGGTDWTSVGAVTSAAALTIPESALLRFLPASDYAGPAPTLVAHLIDSSAGAVSVATVDLSGGGATGNATPYSAATVNTDQTVTEINDAPVAGDDPLSAVLEDSGVRVISFATLLANDSRGGGTDENAQTLTITAVGSPVGGTVAINGTDVEFTPTAGYSGPASFTYTIQDNGTTNAVADPLTDQGSVTFSIDPSNDAPVITAQDDTVSVDQFATLTFNSANSSLITVADIDLGSGEFSVTLSVDFGTVTLATTSGLGFTTGDGTADTTMTFTGTAAEVNAALDGLTFTTTTTNDATLTLTVDDQGNTGADPGLSGTGTSEADTQTIAIDVIPQNAPPVNTLGGPYTTPEENAVYLTGLSISDADAGSATTVTTTLSVLNGFIAIADETGVTVTGDGSSSVQIAGSVAAINAVLAAANNVLYQPNGDFAGTDTLTMVTNDGGASGPGGPKSDTDTADIDVVAANDAPTATITPATYAATENVALDLKNSGLSVADIDAASASVTVTLAVTSGVLNVTAGTSGAGVANSGTATVTLTGTLAQINALLNTDGTSTVSFTETDDSPPASSTLTLSIDDGGATGTGGALTGQDTATINITAVNDAPDVATSSGSTTAIEQSTLTIDSSLTVTDPDGPSETLTTATVAITTGFVSGEDVLGFVNGGGMGNIAGSYDSNTGVLTLSSAGDTATMAEWQTALRAVTYTNTSDAPDTTTRTVTYTVDGLAGGSDSDTIDIDISPVNDAPVNSVPVAQSANQFETFVFSAANSNAISVDDADVDAGDLEVTLSVTGGALTLSTTSGLAFTTGDGTSDATMTFTGSLSAINTALEGLSFVSSVASPPDVTLTIVTDDQGSTGLGGALSDTDTVTITVNPQNAAPVNTLPAGPLMATEETAFFITGISVDDVDDEPTDEPTVTLSVEHGTITVVDTTGVTVAGNGTASVAITGTYAQVNAALAAANNIRYTGVLNYTGPDTLTVQTNDNDLDGLGGPKTDTDTVAMTVANTPDQGAFSQVGDPVATYVENEAAVVIDSDIVYADPDLDVLVETNGNYDGVTLTIQRSGGANADDLFDIGGGFQFSGGQLLNGEGDDIGDVTNAGGVLTITFHSSPTLVTQATAGAVIQAITYANASEAPPASVTLAYSIDDGQGGGTAITNQDVVVNITQVNDGPTAAITPASYTAIEQQSLDLSGLGGVADLDSGILDVTVTLSVGVGTISITDVNANVGIDGNGTSTVTISGTQQRVNTLLSDVTNTISYVANVNAPPASTTLTLHITDNGNTGTPGALTAQDTATINITPVNDAPAGTDNEILIDTDEVHVFSVADFGFTDPLDAGANSFASVVIATLPTEGQLRLNNVAIVAGAEITAAQLNGGQFTFTPDAGESGDNYATFTFQVRDNGGTANGGVDLDATPNTFIIDVNAPPILDGLTDAGYTENAAGVVLSGGLTVTDQSSTLAGATVQITAGLEAGDTLAANTAGTPIAASYDTASGTLTLTGPGTPAQYQQVLRTVTFASSSDNPTDYGTSLARTIEWTVDDGQFQTTATSSLAVTAVNDNPDLTGAGGTVAANEQVAVTLDGDIAVADVDNQTLASATVAITGGFASGQDVLAFVNAAGMGNIAGAYDAGTGVLTLTSAGATATLAQWQTALRAVTYVNTSDTPSTATRTVTFTVNDGAGGSDAVSRQLTVTPVNDAPLLTVSAGVQVVPEQTPTAVDGGLTVSDIDSPTLSQVTFAITEGFEAGEDVLELGGLGGGTGDIVGSYNAATGVLTLTSLGGAAPMSFWQTAMRGVTFTSNSDTPSPGRVVTITATDSDGASSTGTRVLATPNAADAPVVTTTAGATAAGELTPVTIDAGVTVSDPDDVTLVSGKVSISGGFVAGQDVLDFTGSAATGGIGGSYNAATGVLTLTGPATLEQWQAALRAVTYANTSLTPDDGIRTVTFQVDDGGVTSTLAVKQVTVTDDATTPPGFLTALLEDAFEAILRIDPHSAFAQQATILLADGTTVPNPAYLQANQLPGLIADVLGGSKTVDQAIDVIQDFADMSTSVATLSYQFFTDLTPFEAGYDYLVHGPGNANDLSDPYYAKFNLENRFINFAVNLGKLGEGALAFNAEYGALTLQQAMAQAYTEIFGFAPAAGKIDEILNASVGGQTRAEYFASFGGDGLTGIGTKAAGVGFLLVEALKAGIGPYALANANFLDDLADGEALFHVNLLTVYDDPVETSAALIGQGLASPIDDGGL